ncbi:MAG: BON domain-containing protein [Armatimonadota bacterium]
MLTLKTKNRRATAALFTCGIATAALIAGCGDKTPETSTTVINQPAADTATTTTTTTVPGPKASTVVTNDTNAGAGGATGTQTALADEISRAITRNTQMTGSRVNVVVDDAGVATLTGFTQNQQQKALAEKAAKNTAGISLVTNKLDIRPTGGTGKTQPTPPPSGPQTQIIVVPGAAAPAPAAPPASAPGTAGAPGSTNPEVPVSDAPLRGPNSNPATGGETTAPVAPPVPTNP